MKEMLIETIEDPRVLLVLIWEVAVLFGIPFVADSLFGLENIITGITSLILFVAIMAIPFIGGLIAFLTLMFHSDKK